MIGVQTSRTRRAVRSGISLIRALLVVPWMFLWIVPVALALEMEVERAIAVLVALGAVFVWWNVVRSLRSRPRIAASLRLRPWRRYAGWLTVAAVAQLVLTLATLTLHEQLAEWRFLPKLPTGSDLVPPQFLKHALGPIAMLLAVALITPLVEEFGCRGRMQHRLERAFGLVPGVLIPAVIFSLLHGVLVAPHHLAFALFAGWVVWRTGSIWTAVYVHALNNAAVLALLYPRRNWAIASEDVPSWLWPYAIAAGMIAFCGLLAAGWRINRLADRRAGARSRRRPLQRDLTPALRG